MDKNPETTTTKEERASAAAVRKEKNAEYREAKKLVRDAVTLKNRAVDARIQIAKAKKSGKVTASFARLILRMAPALELAAKNPAGVRTVLKNYEDELAKDKNAREFRAPSKGILAILETINAEGWAKATELDAARDAAADAVIAVL